ncbi:MAG: asparagine synthase (glutamine-hydrolyzing) [Rhodospirillales bacterium]|nr:asparagine synthase (glutamine-hydrolyzing) [Rhodospirillales bacterium]
MCGLAALFEPGRRFPAELIDAIESDLLHRGPDSGGRLVEDGWALVFRRLAILDPTAVADQPMVDPTGRFALIFNGEIYNYRALQAELRAAGVRLRTDGDSETILEGFKLWGESIFARLEGMFALILVDRTERVVRAARDPLGIKPLYIARRGTFTAFASEMRPLLRFLEAEPDREALGELLAFRFAAGRRSNLKGIELVLPGTIVTLGLDGSGPRETRFDDPIATLSPVDRPGADAEAAAEAALLASVRDHLQSDVGFALQLSGGIDSSLVAMLAHQQVSGRLRSYAISLGDLPQDEGKWRRMVVERTGMAHTEIEIDNAAYADALPDAVAAMEGPTPHTGCPMLMLLCREIRKTDRVVLTGEGADEFFGGYARYKNWRALRRQGAFARLVPDAAWRYLPRYARLRRYARHDPAIYASVYFDYLAMEGLFPDLAFRPGARADVAGRFADFRDRMTAVDQTAYLGSLLMRQDKMAMSASVEARVPFTHRPLAAQVNSLPRDVRVPGAITKPILKRIAERHLPHELIHRRKVGLTIPVDSWMADEKGLGRYLEILGEPNAALASIGGARRLRETVETFRRAPDKEAAALLLSLVNSELWLRSLRIAPAGPRG